jgi:precorrin-2 methylase
VCPCCRRSISGCLHAANDPALAQWGDALFYSTIGALYRAAQLDAVATVAEAWTETAIRLALYISPIVRYQTTAADRML